MARITVFFIWGAKVVYFSGKSKKNRKIAIYLWVWDTVWGVEFMLKRYIFLADICKYYAKKSGSAFTLSHFNMKKSVKGVVYVKKK